MGSVRDKMVEQIRAAKRAAANIVQKASVVKIVRARNENGHFVKDDPSTPENEAWVEKSAAKPKAKKKAAPKASAKKRGRPRKQV